MVFGRFKVHEGWVKLMAVRFMFSWGRPMSVTRGRVGVSSDRNMIRK